MLASLAAGFLTVSWLGLWLIVPAWSRAVGVVAFAAAAIWIVWQAVRAGWPDRAAALARLDRDSGLSHRPVATAEDALANTGSDPATRALWDLHRKRLQSLVARIKVASPAPGMTKRDAYALRAIALVALVAAAFVAGPEKGGRVAAAFVWDSSTAAIQATRIDAWIDPPGYTGKPPMVLIGSDASPGPAEISAPAGSIVVVRAAGASQVDVTGEGGLRPLPAKAAAAAGKRT